MNVRRSSTGGSMCVTNENYSIAGYLGKFSPFFIFFGRNYAQHGVPISKNHDPALVDVGASSG
jgi:hypothetical protein